MLSRVGHHCLLGGVAPSLVTRLSNATSCPSRGALQCCLVTGTPAGSYLVPKAAQLAPACALVTQYASADAGVVHALAAIFKTGQRAQLATLAEVVWPRAVQLLDSPAAAASVSVRKFATKLVQRIGLVLLPPQHAGWRYQAGASSLTANLANAGKRCPYNPDVLVQWPCCMGSRCCTQENHIAVPSGACCCIDAGSKQQRCPAVCVPVQGQHATNLRPAIRMGVYMPMVLTTAPAILRRQRPPWMTLRCQTRWKR